MNNKKIEKEWKDIVSKSAQEANNNHSDDEIEIVVVDNSKTFPAKTMSKQDSLAFWLNRVKHKNQECIDLIDKTPQTQSPASFSALYSNKIPTPSLKASTPILPHQKEKQKMPKPEVISVEEETAKMNIEKYKNSLFRAADKKAPPKPAYVQSQQSKKWRYKQQEQIIQSMNKPRWMQEKEKRQELNRYKYPVSSAATYGYDHNPVSKGIDTYNEASWTIFQRNREIVSQKNRQKIEEERRKEKEKQKELKQQKKRRDEVQQYKQIFDGLFGTKKQKTDESIPAAEAASLDQSCNDNAKAAQIAQQQRQTIKENIVIQDGEIENNSSFEAIEIKKPRYGIKDIVKVAQSPYSSQIIRAVLAHNYGFDLPIVENKKIPDVFDDPSSYKRIFHFLIANQCIADVSQRMRQVEKQGQNNPIKVSITNLKLNNEGQTEIYIKEINQDKKSTALKNISLSRLRIGLITNLIEYKRENYGISKKFDYFGFLVVLVTPETKEDLAEPVKALCKVNLHDLEMVFRKKKSQQAYFYDLDKLSTHYREYQAITNLPYSELAPVVLNPELMEKEMKDFINKKDCLNDILNYLQKIFNQTQWDSIREMVLRQKGIVLLQGPPGTGKTSTLMGLLSAEYELLKRTNDNRKIMICAPSNAAVDHIVKRLQTEGLMTGDGEIVYPSTLRVGIVETLDEQVRAVSLDDLCEKKIIEADAKANEQRRLTTPQIKEKLITIQKELRKVSGAGSEKQYNQLKQEEIRYENMLYSFREEKVVTARKNYSYYQNQYLNCAEIVLTTLSSAGNDKLDRLKGEIACLIIDEAAQATEPNLLIALQMNVQKVLLIGDPYQLPATCMSSDCNVTLFNRSLFERFLDAGIKPYFLNIQYRMAPLIRQFPSRRFYHSRLVDAASIIERQIPPFLDCINPRNVIFIDTKFGKEMQRGNSHMNEAEAITVGMLVKCLLQTDITMGIITPYQAQRSIIARECKSAIATLKDQAPMDLDTFQKTVMINTVDSFQGQERDVIIVSTVRANNRQHLGFLTDERRINVTLTRAKFLLVIVGNGDTLGSNQVWNEFLEWVEREKVYYQLNTPNELRDVLNHLFKNYNDKPIKRKRYKQLTTDIRKINRGEMQFNDVKKKAYEKLSNKNSQEDKQSLNGDQSIGLPAAQTRGTVEERGVEEKRQAISKYALDIKQSQKIREQKRQKQKETQQYHAMTDRMRILEQQMKQDSDYKNLFS